MSAASNLQLMHVAQVGPPFRRLRLNHGVVQVQIAIPSLRAPYHTDELLDGTVHLLVVTVMQDIAGRLNPFADVAGEAAERTSTKQTRSVEAE